VILDVIRSPRGNSLRFFFVEYGKLVHHLVVNESGNEASKLFESGDRITRSCGPLHFDLSFSVSQSTMPVSPWNPYSLFAITAQDHPKVEYRGTIAYQVRLQVRRSRSPATAPPAPLANTLAENFPTTCISTRTSKAANLSLWEPFLG